MIVALQTHNYTKLHDIEEALSKLESKPSQILIVKGQNNRVVNIYSMLHNIPIKEVAEWGIECCSDRVLVL